MGCPSSKLVVAADPEDDQQSTQEESRTPSSVRQRLSSFGSFSKKSGVSSTEIIPVRKSNAAMEKQIEKYNYPSPFPSQKRKEEIFNKEDYVAVDERAKSMPVKVLYGSYKSVAKYLTKPYNTDLEKIRSIFVWATTLDINKFQFCFDQLPNRNTPLEAMFRIHWKLADYAHLFVELCRTAHIPCILVTGVTKTRGYHLGKKLDRNSMTTDWNAVYVEGEWRLIDVQLATSLVPSRSPNPEHPEHDVMYCNLSTSMEHCDVNEAFFLMDPDHFIYFHFPDDPAWQLLENPLSMEQFMQNAFLRERYFEFGLQVTVPEDYDDGFVLHTDQGTIHLQYSIPEDKANKLSFRHSLWKHSRKKGSTHNLNAAERFVFYQKTPYGIKYEIRLPAKGKFKLDILGKEDGVHEDYAICASYMLRNEAKQKLSPFPDCPDIGWGLGQEAAKLGLTAKSHDSPVIVSSDGVVEVRFGLEGDMAVAQHLKHNLFDEFSLKQNVMVQKTGEEMTVTVRLQQRGEYALGIYAGRPGAKGELANVCNYLLTCKSDYYQTPFPRIHDAVIGVGFQADELHVKPNQQDNILHTMTGKLLIEFETDAKLPVELLAELHSNEWEAQGLSECVTTTMAGHEHQFDIHLPAKGEYAFNVYGRKVEDDKYRLYHVHTYFILSVQETHDDTIAQADLSEDVAPYHTNGDAAVITVPGGERPRTTELQRRNCQHSEHGSQVLYCHTKKKDIFRVSLPDVGEYRLSIFDENFNDTLSLYAQYAIFRHKPLPGELEDREEEMEDEQYEEKLTEAEHDGYRKALRKVTLYRDVAALQEAVDDFEFNCVKEEDGDLTRAKRRLDYLRMDEALSDAMQKRTLSDLEPLLKNAEDRGLDQMLGLKFQMANKIKDQLVRLEKLQTETLNFVMDEGVLTGMQNIANPPPIIMNVMKAMFIILGEKETNVKNWKCIQRLLNTTATKSLKRRIVDFDLDNLKMDTCQRAKGYLKMNLSDVRNTSEICTIFYMWSKGMVDEAEARFSQRKDAWKSEAKSRRRASVFA